MNIIAVDYESSSLKHLTQLLNTIVPNANIYSFNTVQKALAFVKENSVQIAFIDMRIPYIGGIEFAKHIKQLCPAIVVFLISTNEEYSRENFSFHSRDLLIKPLDADLIMQEMMCLKDLFNNM